jgi:mobilome CxxCx(11)CxxC protein
LVSSIEVRPNKIGPAHRNSLHANGTAKGWISYGVLLCLLLSKLFQIISKEDLMATDEQRKDCWNKAIYAFGTAYVFDERFQRARRKLRLLNYIALAIPIILGGIVVAFYETPAIHHYLTILIIIAGLLGTLQVAFSVWALTAKWDDTAAYASVSTAENRRLAARFEELAKFPPPDFDMKYELLKNDNMRREELDIQQGITEKEKRKITRAGIRQYQRACVGCGEVPKDMNSTQCHICGKF